MALLLAPISVADFSGMESKMLTTAVLAGEMILLGGARERRSPAMWPCTASPLSGFPGKDPPMVKSATDQ